MNFLALATIGGMYYLQRKKRTDYQNFRKHKEKWFNNSEPMYGKMNKALLPGAALTTVISVSQDNVIHEEDT